MMARNGSGRKLVAAPAESITRAPAKAKALHDDDHIIARDGGAARKVANKVVKKKMVKVGLFDPGSDWKFDITAIPDDKTCLISLLSL